MKIEIMEQQKQVCIWLTKDESANEELQEKMRRLLESCREKHFFFTIYRSGTQDLTELTSALLIYNIRRAAERAVEESKATSRSGGNTNDGLYRTCKEAS